MAEWISVIEAAELSGYSSEQIRRLIRGSYIKAEKKGPMYWVDRKSLNAYVEEARHSDDKRKGPKASDRQSKSQ